LETLDERIRVTNENLKALDKKLTEVQKKRKKSQAELESYRLREREIADKVSMLQNFFFFVSDTAASKSLSLFKNFGIVYYLQLT
jgi:hypothetical protein